jgi:hypothetical protein
MTDVRQHHSLPHSRRAPGRCAGPLALSAGPDRRCTARGGCFCRAVNERALATPHRPCRSPPRCTAARPGKGKVARAAERPERPSTATQRSHATRRARLDGGRSMHRASKRARAGLCSAVAVRQSGRAAPQERLRLTSSVRERQKRRLLAAVRLAAGRRRHALRFHAAGRAAPPAPARHRPRLLDTVPHLRVCA